LSIVSGVDTQEWKFANQSVFTGTGGASDEVVGLGTDGAGISNDVPFEYAHNIDPDSFPNYSVIFITIPGLLSDKYTTGDKVSFGSDPQQYPIHGTVDDNSGYFMIVGVLARAVGVQIPVYNHKQ
tara:strand:- start:2893 stop:3267 length:375 start_codon:yes stop_codon:yes gene_type:complete